MTTTHRIATTGLLILSLAAVAAPAASAMPVGGDTAGAPKPAPVAAYSREDKSIIVATTPASTPTTSGPRSEVVSGGGYGSGTAAAPTVVRVVDGNSGFDWVDAGIGAVGGIALSMLALGAAHGVSQHRTRTRHTAALSG
jgi:hypothetical protein